MSQHYAVLIVIMPLLFAFVVSGAAWVKKTLCFPLAVVGMGLSAWFSVCLLGQVATTGLVEYRLGGWMTPWGIGYRVDTLNGMVVAVVAVLAFINLIATRKTVVEETPDKTGAFYSLYLLFMVGLTGILVTGGPVQSLCAPGGGFPHQLRPDRHGLRAGSHVGFELSFRGHPGGMFLSPGGGIPLYHDRVPQHGGCGDPDSKNISQQRHFDGFHFLHGGGEHQDGLFPPCTCGSPMPTPLRPRQPGV